MKRVFASVSFFFSLPFQATVLNGEGVSHIILDARSPQQEPQGQYHPTCNNHNHKQESRSSPKTPKPEEPQPSSPFRPKWRDTLHVRKNISVHVEFSLQSSESELWWHRFEKHIYVYFIGVSVPKHNIQHYFFKESIHFFIKPNYFFAVKSTRKQLSSFYCTERIHNLSLYFINIPSYFSAFT